MVLAAVALVVVGLAVYAWWSRESAKLTTRAWDEFNTALESANPAALAKVIEDLPGTTVADMAATVSADLHLGLGCHELFVNKATAQEDLTKAIELYSSVREHSRLPSLLERATFGLARAKEAKGDAANIDQAMKLYEEVAVNWPNGAFAAAASQRLEDLKRPATKELYDRFAHFDPKPVFSSEPRGRLPFDSTSMPSESPLSFPSTPSDLKPEDKGKDQATTEERKPSDSMKPADETQPSDENKPADTAKPAEGMKTPDESGK
jgi:hypothetical protein